MQSTIFTARSAMFLLIMLASTWAQAAEDMVRWRRDLEEAKQEASKSGRLVLLHFYGSSCPPCAKLDKEVFSQKKAADALEVHYVPLKVNVDHSMAIASAYNVTSWPTDVILTPTGQVIAKFVSPQGVQPYLGRMDQVALAAREQAAKGLVNMGPNGTNPYSAIASEPAVTAAGNPTQANGTGEANNQFAAPTQYQEPVPGYPANNAYNSNGPAGAPGSPDIYGQQGGANPYGQGQSPYGQGANQAAQAPAGDRYANPAGDRYAAPQAGPYAAQPSVDKYDTGSDARYGTDSSNGGVGANYNAAVAGAEGAAYGTQGGSAPQTQSQVQPNPYAAPAQDYTAGNPGAGSRYDAAGAAGPQVVTNPTAPAYNPGQYGNSPPAGPQIQPTDNGAGRYGAAPQQSPPAQYSNNPYGAGVPAGGPTGYSQAPALGGQAPANPPSVGPAGTSVAQQNPPQGGRPSVQQVSGNPSFGLDGFCPVTLAEKQRWTQGDKAWGAVHLGQTYLFTTQEQQQKFLANPDAFAPVLSGHDPVLVLEQNVHRPGSRAHGVFYREKIYLFSGEESLARFSKDPERYANGVRQAMLQMRGAAGDQRR